ncbi:hypothetical protein PRZ48_007765 [Zasmidium cellare]|uniref:Uncharacterized protein n=1 Tax=Zasmidium cellare TaxID=395010 RepID=A0ABR0EL22_ZASCE|nr:hypothetical protein PRZ48_007765 [Zasmidium cellare]
MFQLADHSLNIRLLYIQAAQNQKQQQLAIASSHRAITAKQQRKGSWRREDGVKHIPNNTSRRFQDRKAVFDTTASQHQPLCLPNELRIISIRGHVGFEEEETLPETRRIVIFVDYGFNVVERNRELGPSYQHTLSYDVTWDALKYRNGAVNARVVEKNLKKIFEGRTVVVHAGKQDKLAFQYEQAFEAAKEVVDTQKVFAYLQFDGQPRLALAADVILGKVVQGGGGGDHSPVEDAQTAGELFVVGCEKGLISKYSRAGE